MRRGLWAPLLLAMLCGCPKQQGTPPPVGDGKSGLNSPCTSNADCQGMMCRHGRCH